MVLDYPGRYHTPSIEVHIDMQPILDRIALCDSESKDYIDAFIRQLRRDWKRKPLKWWKKWLRK